MFHVKHCFSFSMSMKCVINIARCNEGGLTDREPLLTNKTTQKPNKTQSFQCVNILFASISKNTGSSGNEILPKFLRWYEFRSGLAI